MMKSVGEVMAIGRTWTESFQKALRGLETGLDGWDLPKNYKRLPKDQMMYKLRVPNPDRMVVMRQAFEEGLTADDLFELTKIDPWWLKQLEELYRVQCWLQTKKLEGLDKVDMLELKQRGFSDAAIGRYVGSKMMEVGEGGGRAACAMGDAR